MLKDIETMWSITIDAESPVKLRPDLPYANSSLPHMSPETHRAQPEPRPKLWRNVLLFVGSAAFGGLAVALWNRRELAQFQSERSRQIASPTPASDADEEII